MTTAVVIPEVTSMTIEVAVIRVGDRQMTKAVYRQIVMDVDITGPIWGWVNDHTPGCSEAEPRFWETKYAEHLHIIWQDGHELRHAIQHQAFASEQSVRNALWRYSLEEAGEFAYDHEVGHELARTAQGKKITSPASPYKYLTRASLPDVQRDFAKHEPEALRGWQKSRETWAEGSTRQLFIAV